MAPRLTDGSQGLIEAASGFVFNGTPTSMLHPEVRREACFPDSAIMPVAELPVIERTAAVAAAVSYSMRFMLLEQGFYPHTPYISKIQDPRAYVELLKAGKKIALKSSEYNLDPDEAGIHPNTTVVAGVMYKEFARIFPGRKDEKFGLAILRSIEPPLGPNETKEQRSANRTYNEVRRRHRGRYIRTLGFAAAAFVYGGCELDNSFEARITNKPKIEALTEERALAGPDELEEIDKEIWDLRVENEGLGPYLLAAGGIALLRSGTAYLGRPRRPARA